VTQVLDPPARPATNDNGGGQQLAKQQRPFEPLAPIGTAGGLKALLESQRNGIAQALPRHVTPERLIKTLLVAANRIARPAPVHAGQHPRDDQPRGGVGPGPVRDAGRGVPGAVQQQDEAPDGSEFSGSSSASSSSATAGSPSWRGSPARSSASTPTSSARTTSSPSARVRTRAASSSPTSRATAASRSAPTPTCSSRTAASSSTSCRSATSRRCGPGPSPAATNRATRSAPGRATGRRWRRKPSSAASPSGCRCPREVRPRARAGRRGL
jgi:hypothetical protein